MAEEHDSQECLTLDEELVRRVQRGDVAAFDLLVRKYQHRIAALIGRYVADWSEVQDVAQETFIRAYRAVGNFRGDAQFYTWLHRIAANNALMVVRKRKPQTQLTDFTDPEQPVVLSDDKAASGRIETFANATMRWMVAVRMVSEGVDVPRLAVGVYATSASTPLSAM